MTTKTQATFSKPNMFTPEAPSAWQRLRHNLILFIAQWLYTHQPVISIPPPTSALPVKVVCISDTHNEQPRDIPLGDILIHAGDMTLNGTFEELQDQLNWMSSLPHRHKIVVTGNHDLLLDQSFLQRNPRLASLDDEYKPKQLEWGTVVYLENESKVLNVRDKSVRVYGSPMTPKYGNWAFQYQGEDVWNNTVPEATDILVTHGPAKGHLDTSPSHPSYLQGCAHLQRELWRIKPQLHIHGHIHSARGLEHSDWGWLRRGYDAVCCGEGGIGDVLLLLATWVWLWPLYGLGRERNASMTTVNAVVVGIWD